MASPQERQKILEMVAAGKIGAQEAAELLKATDDEATKEQPPRPAQPEPPAPSKMTEPTAEQARGPSWLRVRVDDLASGRRKVSVNIPLRLMKVGLQFGGAFAPELRDVDWEGLSTSLAEGEGGLLVEVEDEEDGEHVRIYVE